MNARVEQVPTSGHDSSLASACLSHNHSIQSARRGHADLPALHLLRPPRPSSAEGTLQFITSGNLNNNSCIYKQNDNYHSRNINCIYRHEAQVTGPQMPPLAVQNNGQSHCIRHWTDWRRPSSSSISSPPSPTPSSLPSSLPSTRVSQEFNDWYQRLRIHSVYDFETDTTLKSRSSLKDWVRHQPLAVLHLDPVDRIVLKIADERDAIQKKTFTKWINKHLVKASKRVVDLFEDLRDGDNLISLLEVLSGEHLPRERGRMRVHMLQNAQIALNFLKYRKIKLVNIRPDDVVDGNQKLTLGLVWTIILHYQISDIIQHDDSLSFKEALLRWAQRTTEGYPGVRITDFTSSWRDGLAFNAIIHRNRPDLIDYRSCLKRSARENLESMFQITERELGVTRLLDAEDVDTSHPDEKSLITYISSLYELFPDPSPRNPLLEDEKIRRIEEYRDSAMRMVRWISETTTRLRDRNWPNTVSELKMIQTDHNRFRTEEIASKLHEKQRLSHSYREVSRLALELDTPIMIDHEISSDNIDILWNRMMAAHQERDQDLIDSILQLEKLQRLADKVSREAKHCEARLDEIDMTIVETSKKIARSEPRDLKTTCDQIASEMKLEGDRIAGMLNDVQILLDNKYHKANDLRIRVEQLHKRWTEMGFVFKTRVIEAITKRKSDGEKISRIEEYGGDASRLIKWIKDATMHLKDRNWPNSLTELKTLQTENNRFRSDEIPGKLHEKQRLTHLFRDVSRMALELSSPVTIDPELSADNIEILWKRMMTAHQDRDHDLLEAILRQEKLQRMAEKLMRDMKHCEDRLDDIDSGIREISSKIERGDLRGVDSVLLERISSEMRTEGDRIAAMMQDVQYLEDNRYNRSKELRNGVENLQRRLNEMGFLFESKVSEALSRRKSDEEKAKRIDEYSESAFRLVKWMREATTRLKDRSWPNTAAELKSLQAENNRFRSDEVPAKLHEKQRLAQAYREVSKMAQELRGIEIDSELTAENMDLLWNRMMAAHQERDHDLLEAILRQEKLERLAEKVAREMKHCESRLDEIDESIHTISSKIERGDLKGVDSQSCDQIAVELKTEGERISSMRQDVQVLQENKYHRVAELREGVEHLHQRWSEMGIAFKSRVVEALSKLRADNEKMGRIEHYAEAAVKLIKWIEEQTSRLQTRNWPNSLSELKQLQSEHNRFRSEEIPPKQSDKQRLAKAYREISEMAMELSHPATISPELSADRIDSIWNRMMAAYEERSRDLLQAIQGLEDLEKAYAKVVQEIRNSEARLDSIESNIHETSRKIERGDMRDVRAACDQIVKDMDLEADTIAGLKLDVQSLISKKCHEANRLLPLVDALQKRLNELGLIYKAEVVEALMRRKSDEENIRKIQEYLDELLSWLSKAEKTVAEIKPMYGDQQVIETDLAKLKVTINDMDSHQQSVDTLNAAGKKLIEAGGPEAASLKHKLDDLNSRWNELRRVALEKQKLLEQMLREVMNFNEELQDLLSWMAEVDAQLVTSKPVGGLPETAREQLNSFMDLYEEIESNRTKVESMLVHGADIVDRSPQQTSNLQHSLKMLKQRWDHIQSRANDKKVKLEIALREALEFHEALEEFVGWLTSAEKHLANAPPVSRLMESVTQQIEAHKKFQQDVDAHRETMLALDKKGTHLKYFSQKQDVILIKNMLVSVQHRWERVCSKSTERSRALEQGLREAKDFHDSWHELVAWLKHAEKQLDDVHASENMPEKIKTMLLKHKEFQRALGAKQGTYDATMKAGRALKEKAPRNDVPVLQEMLEELKTRWNSVCAKSVDRQRKLEESLLFSGQFKEAVDALIDWLDRAKTELSLDRLHGDLDTVTALVEQHKGFQEDFKSRAKQLAQVRKTASELLQTAVAEDAAVIRQQLSSVESKWEEVSEMSSKKERKLQEALRLAEELHKSVHSLLEWLSDAEMKLRFANSLPDDEEGTRQQIAEHERISREMVQKEVEKDRTIRLAQEILTKCHPDAVSTINHWISIIESRWEEVSQWIRGRGQKLRDHLSSIKELTDLLSELMTWLRRKESELHTAESIPLPDDIPSIERLIDEHQRFIDELASRQHEVERVVKAFTSIRKTTEEEVGRTSRTRGRYTPLKSSTPTRTTVETEVVSPRAAELLDKWHYVWNLAQERMRRLQERLGYVTELERIKNFDFEEWRRRFLAYLNNKKARVMDFYRKIDTDNDCRVTQAEFIEGFLKSSFPTSRLEMERVAPIFDRNSDGFIDHREYLETLRANQDFPKTDLDIIQDEVQKAVAKCTCAIRYKVFHVGEGKYRFGESQKLRLVRILRSTVMVRVGGGWVSLDEFLVKNDPCRAKGRTNVELREQFVLADGVSQSMTPFVSKMRSQQSGRQETVTLPTTGPVTKIREKTERSMPMYSQRRIESTSDYSFGETDSGTKSRPRSRLTGSGSRPASRSESRGPSSRNGSRPASRANSDLSAESIEGYSKKTTPTRMRFSTTASGLRRTPSTGANGSSAKERWK